MGIAGSSNGRTTDSGSVYLGSNPSPAAKSLGVYLVHPPGVCLQHFRVFINMS